MRALEAVADQGPLPQAELDSLSMLEGDDLVKFQETVARLPGDARARLVRGLQGAAEQRLRLDYTAINHLALEDSEAPVRLAGVQSALEDRSPYLLSKLLDLVGSDPSHHLFRGWRVIRICSLCRTDVSESKSGRRDC